MLVAELVRAISAIACLARLFQSPSPRRAGGLVEEDMTFITPGVAAAGIKATGSVTSALIGRYRPTGVARLGSKEDRRGAYVRLMDSSARSFNYAYQFAHLQREVRGAGKVLVGKVLLGQLPQMWEINSELIGALNEVRLCGTTSVVAAAEALVGATSDLVLNEKSADRFQQQAEAVTAARTAFLDVCREDLGYTTHWWQVRRRREERRALRARQTGDSR